jgi:hypothetical protein
MAGGGQYGTLMGNVGIGTTAPAYKLDVAGPINATGFYVNGSLLQTGGAASGRQMVLPFTTTIMSASALLTQPVN